MKPLQLFIVCNILFFFLLGKSNVFAQSFYTYKKFSPYTYLGTGQIIAAKAKTEEQEVKLATLFNERIITQSKTFIIVFIPFFAIFFSLLFIKKKKYFTEHLVFATHYFSFLMLCYIAFNFLALLPFYYFLHADYNSGFDLIYSFASLFLLAIYFVVAAKRFYSISNSTAIISGILITVLITFSLLAYRMFLFYKIIYSLH
jgi:hypothetical protein